MPIVLPSKKRDGLCPISKRVTSADFNARHKQVLSLLASSQTSTPIITFRDISLCRPQLHSASQSG